MRLRNQLNNRKKLGYNRHARAAVRVYYGLPRATANVANQLIDWKNGDTVGSFEKREAWRVKTWGLWDIAAIRRDIQKFNKDYDGWWDNPNSQAMTNTKV